MALPLRKLHSDRELMSCWCVQRCKLASAAVRMSNEANSNTK